MIQSRTDSVGGTGMRETYAPVGYILAKPAAAISNINTYAKVDKERALKLTVLIYICASSSTHRSRPFIETKLRSANTF